MKARPALILAELSGPMPGRAGSTPLTPKMRVLIGAGRRLGPGSSRPPAAADTRRSVRVSPAATALTPGSLAIETTDEAGSGPSCLENCESCLKLVPSGGPVPELPLVPAGGDREGEGEGGPPEGVWVTVNSEPTP